MLGMGVGPGWRVPPAGQLAARRVFHSRIGQWRAIPSLRRHVARASGSYQPESMPNVLIRDLPPQAHARLVQKARAAGQSLQQYLLTELIRLSGERTMDDVLADIARHEGGRVGLSTAVGALHGDRPAG